MEAILYNMNTYLQQTSPVEMCHDLRDKQSEAFQALSSYMCRRLVTVTYHLQCSAVSSQIGKH